MTRRTVARLVVRALPGELVARRGAEIEGTLLDAGEQSRGAFVTEAASILRAAFVARARAGGDQPVPRMARDVLGWAAVLIAAQIMVSFLDGGLRMHFLGASVTQDVLAIALPLLIVLLWSVGSSRVTGLAGVIWAVWSLVEVSPSAGVTVLLEVKVALVGFLVLMATPVRPTPRARLLWLLPMAMLAVNLFALNSLAFGLLTPLLVACVLPLAPAFALGATVAWSASSLNAVLIVPTATASTFQVVLIASPLAALALIAATRRLAPTRN